MVGYEHTLRSDEYRTLWKLICENPHDAKAMKEFSANKHFSGLDTHQTEYNYIKFMELYGAIIRSAVQGKNQCVYLMTWNDASPTDDMTKTKKAIEYVLKDIGYKIIDVWHTEEDCVVWSISWK